MVEAEAKDLSEPVMLGAVMFAHQQMQAAIQGIKDLVTDAGKPAWDWKAPSINADIEKRVTELAEADIAKA